MSNTSAITITPCGLLAVALLGSVVALLFGAVPLAAWADALPGSPITVPLQQAADTWRDVVQRVGFDQPYDVLRTAVRKAEAAHFGD